jgi:hypothetical protein
VFFVVCSWWDFFSGKFNIDYFVRCSVPPSLFRLLQQAVMTSHTVGRDYYVFWVILFLFWINSERVVFDWITIHSRRR